MHYLLDTDEIKNAMEDFRNERLEMYQGLFENNVEFRKKQVEQIKNKSAEELLVDYVYRKLFEEGRIK